ncbi:hypothetical protein [uncultured Pseudokineococcus sp.]|uniref:hypothetical protein n=1 Tax=uncultured Pseudokineococcus sp. TaxID=1642928 RepID=UPI00262720F9|nr:hypothetical protein [uncultured Pseudokineococcus sp.]
MSPSQHPRRPTFLGPRAMDSLESPGDATGREAAAHATARLLVEGAQSSGDAEVAGRLVGLADEHGLELLAQLWADASPESLPGALWRLYVLRQWVHAAPAEASRQFDEGRRRAPVLEAVAGVADPPGPDEVRQQVDAVLAGVATGDFAVTLERAGAFARVVAVGRADLADSDVWPAGDSEDGLTTSAARLVRTAEHLEACAGRWRSGSLL